MTEPSRPGPACGPWYDETPVEAFFFEGPSFLEFRLLEGRTLTRRPAKLTRARHFLTPSSPRGRGNNGSGDSVALTLPSPKGRGNKGRGNHY